MYGLTMRWTIYRDFFPVILTFLRQLPFIGNLLQLPVIRDVRLHLVN